MESHYSAFPGEPLAAFRLFGTREIDVARDVVGRTFCPHRLEVPRHALASFDTRHNHVAGAFLSLNHLGYGAEVEINPGRLRHFYLVQIPLAGSAQITNGQRILRERNAAIQAAGQKALAEVERVMLYVIRQVAESRGLTMVVQRQAIVLAVEEHDISEAVANQLNRALTSVPLDPDPAEAAAPTPPARRN